MPTTTVWLDEDRNVVDRDRATQAVETETDDQGRLVQERWIRIARPGSAIADEIGIYRQASELAARRRRVPRWIWGLVVIVVAALAIWLLAR